MPSSSEPGGPLSLYCLSITFRTAPAALRDRLSYPADVLEVALARAGCGRVEGRPGLSELAILSTCNRLELYAVAPDAPDAGRSEAVWADLRAFVAETRALGEAELEPHAVRHADAEAARHLCRVAAGLDSMVLGESEILGQVADAQKAAMRQRSGGPVLAALFRTAIRAGRRARTETPIGRKPMSVGSVAVALAAQATGDLAGRCVAVVGAGRMARKAVTAFRARGVGGIIVVNRTQAAAAELASAWGGEASTFEELPQVLGRADIVISSTGAPHTVIGAPVVRQAMVDRQRPLVLIDIAIPRDVEAAVGGIPGVHLFDLDDLAAPLDENAVERRKEIPRVEAIVAEEVGRFAEWQAEREILPLVSTLRQQAESVRSQELNRLLRQLPELDAAVQERVDQFSRALVNKLLHEPTERLRAEATNGNAVEYAEVARALFGLAGPR